MKDINIAYFGGEPIGVPVLNELEKSSFHSIGKHNIKICCPNIKTCIDTIFTWSQ